MKSHRLLRLGDKGFILGEGAKGLSHREHRFLRRIRRQQRYAAEVLAGHIRRLEGFVFDPCRRFAENLGVDFGKRIQLRVVRAFSHHSIRGDKVVVIKRRHNAGLHQLGLDNASIARDILVMILNLIALNREPRVVAAVVAGHVVVFQPKNVERQSEA